jgi:hypothetical protein
MKIIRKIIAASMILAAFVTQAQQEENRSFIQNIGIKINYARNHNFKRDALPPQLNWELLNTTTARLGLSYDWKRNKKLNYNFNISIDWLTDKNRYLINDTDFDENIIERKSGANGYVYFILETQLLYELNKKGNLHAMIAPQINYRLFNDEGSSGLGGTNTLNGYNFRLSTVDRNRIIRPSLALGIQYDLPTKTKMRLGAFYSYSFTPIYFGEFTYQNSNAVTASGEWEQKGHQAGITFQIFPFFKNKK